MQKIDATEKKTILKAEKVKLTAGRIADFQCPKDKTRTYLWCDEVKGLGVIATAAGAKSYIFQAKVNGQSMRLTIGGVCAWSIAKAQAEARRLQTIIDTGDDPRRLKAEQQAAKDAARQAEIDEAAALIQKQANESVTALSAWIEYMEERKQHWGERHFNDHASVIHAGGETRARSRKLTEPAVMASLMSLRLIDLTADRVTAWAKVEGVKRAGRARLASRLLKAFLTWCNEHETYGVIVTSNAAKNKKAREQLGKPKSFNDVLQREQLTAWFDAMLKISNPVQSAYFQALLLTGARPNELTAVKWEDVNFQWEHLTIRDKVEGLRVIPLTPYLGHLLATLPRRNEFVFSSHAAASGHIEGTHTAFKTACAIANIDTTLYGLRRSFATLSEWVEVPAGIAAQIQGHKPSGVREKHYIRRPLDLLRKWHVKIEAWILEQAGIEFVQAEQSSVLRMVKG